MTNQPRGQGDFGSDQKRSSEMEKGQQGQHGQGKPQTGRPESEDDDQDMAKGNKPGQNKQPDENHQPGQNKQFGENKNR
jgi:hypothetical protein